MTEDWRFYDVFFTRAREYYTRGLKALSALRAVESGAKPGFGPAAEESSVLSGPAAGSQAYAREVLSASDWVRQAQAEDAALSCEPNILLKGLDDQVAAASRDLRGELMGTELTPSGGLLLSLSDDFIRFRHAAYKAAQETDDES